MTDNYYPPPQYDGTRGPYDNAVAPNSYNPPATAPGVDGSAAPFHGTIDGNPMYNRAEQYEPAVREHSYIF